MLIAREIAYHAAREKACRANAARAADDDAAGRHNELARMHAERREALEAEAVQQPAAFMHADSAEHQPSR